MSQVQSRAAVAADQRIPFRSADGIVTTHPYQRTASHTNPATHLSTFKRAYLLTLFCYLQLLCSVLNGFFTIAENVAKFYDVSVELVNLMGTVIYLLAALKFPAMYLTERFGVLPALYTGMFFFTLGTAVLRPLGGDSFEMVFFGTVVAQLGQPFFQCLAASIPAHYFPEEARALPTALGIASDTTGVGVGMFVCGLPVFATDPRVFINFTGGCNLLGLLLFVPLIFCGMIPNRGKRSAERRYSGMLEDVGGGGEMTDLSGSVSTRTNVSQGQLHAHGAGEIPAVQRGRSSLQQGAKSCASKIFRCCPLVESMALLFSQCPEFSYAFYGISVLFGVFNAHLTVISEVFPSDVASPNVYAGIFFLTGLLGNVVQGSILDSGRRTHAQLIKVIIVTLFGLFSVTALVWTSLSYHLGFPTLYVLAALMGLGGPGLAATVIGFVLQATSYKDLERRISGNLESTVTGLMLLGFCLVTAVLNIVLNPETLGPQVGGGHVLPWIWWALSIPGYVLLWRACSIVD